MDEDQIKEEFLKALQKRGVSKELDIHRSMVSVWKNKLPSVGTMLEVLLKLNKITIVKNEP